MSAGNPGQKVYVYAVFFFPELSGKEERVLENWPRLRERCWILSSETATAFLNSSDFGASLGPAESPHRVSLTSSPGASRTQGLGVCTAGVLIRGNTTRGNTTRNSERKMAL